jgi:hypothetical protein
VSEALSLAAKTRAQGQNGALGSGSYVTFISASCSVAKAVKNNRWIDDIIYALRATSSVPDLTDPTYFGDEDAWRVKCLADVLGFRFGTTGTELIHTLIVEGWQDSLQGLFQATRGALYQKPPS